MPHTPGPLLIDTSFATQIGIITADLKLLAVVMRTDDVDQLANARLFAAAPDLLAACQMVLGDPGLTASANSVVRDAIHKAIG